MKKKALLTVGLSFMIIFSANSVKAGEWKAMWKKNNTGWWYENTDGSYPYSAWKEIKGKWYYFDSRGYCVMNTWIGNYYLGSSGAMLVNTTTPDGYKVDENGKWIEERQATWKKNDTGWWYEEKDGSYPTSTWKEIKGKWYYFDSRGYCVMNTWIGNYYLGSSGAMLVNTTTPDGYRVDENGKWIDNKVVNQKDIISLYGRNLTQEQIDFTDNAAKKIAKEIIKPNMTDREKAREITKWIFANTIKDHRQSTEIYKKTHADTAWAVFSKGRAACSGYVRAFKLLGKYAGLKVKIVNEDLWQHQWNTVYLQDEGKWIDCDSQSRTCDGSEITPKEFGIPTYKIENKRLVYAPFPQIGNPYEDFVEEYNSGHWHWFYKFSLSELKAALESHKKWNKFEWLHNVGDRESFDESMIK